MGRERASGLSANHQANWPGGGAGGGPQKSLNRNGNGQTRMLPFRGALKGKDWKS